MVEEEKKQELVALHIHKTDSGEKLMATAVACMCIIFVLLWDEPDLLHSIISYINRH